MLVGPALVGCGDSEEPAADRRTTPPARPAPDVRVVAGPKVIVVPGSGRYAPTQFHIFVRLDRAFPRSASTGRTRGFIELRGGLDDLGAGEPFAHSRRRHCYSGSWAAGRSLRNARDGEQVTVRTMLIQPKEVVDEARPRAQEVPDARFDAAKRTVLADLGCGTRGIRP